MNDHDLVQSLKTAITYHETQAVRYRKMLAIAGDDSLQAPPSKQRATVKTTKAKPGKKTAAGSRPTPAALGGQPALGKRAQHRADSLEKMRALLKADSTISVVELARRLKLSWNLAKELHGQASA